MPETRKANKTKRVNITLPADWHEAFVEAAQHDGMTLSEWLRECGAVYLDPDVRKDLSTPATEGRPRNVHDDPSR